MSPELETLIAWARNYKPTPEEQEETRRSFAYGNVALHNPSITRADVDRVADEEMVRTATYVRCVCKASCLRTSTGIMLDDTNPFPRHNCEARLAQDTADLLPGGGQ